MAADGDSSEISPLLGDRENVETNGTINSVLASGRLTTDSADTSGDLERQESVDQSRAAQLEGLPEIQKNFKYILPAISIGVRLAVVK